MTEAMPDFVRLFNERLEAIEPLDEDNGTNYGWGRHADSTYTIKRKCPAVVFYPEEGPRSLNIWIVDPDDIDPNQPTHTQVKNSLRKDVPHLPLIKAISSYIRQD